MKKWEVGVAHATLLKCSVGVTPTVLNHSMESTFNLQPSTKIHANAVWEEVVYLKCSVLGFNNHLGLCFASPWFNCSAAPVFKYKILVCEMSRWNCYRKKSTKKKDDFTSVSPSSKRKAKANHLKHQFFYLISYSSDVKLISFLTQNFPPTISFQSKPFRSL